MVQETVSDIIRELTGRALWEVRNVIDCIPDSCWNKRYCGVPVWQHVYHMLHSLDQWLINPKNFREPPIHAPELNNLDIPPAKTLTRAELDAYFCAIKDKITLYLAGLRDEALLTYPEGCAYTKFTLILGQHRHLHTHMGMLMGFIVNDTGKWPMVIGLTAAIPTGEYDKFN